jgi:hypothetical protein
MQGLVGAGKVAGGQVALQQPQSSVETTTTHHAPMHFSAEQCGIIQTCKGWWVPGRWLGAKCPCSSRLSTIKPASTFTHETHSPTSAAKQRSESCRATQQGQDDRTITTSSHWYPAERWGNILDARKGHESPNCCSVGQPSAALPNR